MKHRFSVKETTILIVTLTLLIAVWKKGKSIYIKSFHKNVLIYNTRIEDYNININQQNKDTIFTTFFTLKKDPRRDKYMPNTFDYMDHFYISVKFLKLNVIIFYDNLTIQFIHKYQTNEIRFTKVQNNSTRSGNDYRFYIYKNWLETHFYERILMVDIRDVFFWEDPFEYMKKHNKYKLFLSQDRKNISSSIQRIFHSCYNTYFTFPNNTFYNAGKLNVKILLICQVLMLNWPNK